MRRLGAAIALLPLAAQAAGAPNPAAQVTLVTGRGSALGTEGVRSLAKGDPVYSGEIVHSSANSYVDLRFSDGGYFLLRPNTRFHVVDFVNQAGTPPAPAAPPPPKPETPAAPAAAATAAAPAPLSVQPQGPQGGASRAIFSLLKGGFRSISGLIGKINHDEYQVTTPVATIGIRGTDYLVVICDFTCATDPTIAGLVPPGVSPLGGIVSTVYSDSVVITDAGGTVQLLEGQYLLVLPTGVNILLPIEPHFLHVDPTPNPATCSG